MIVIPGIPPLLNNASAVFNNVSLVESDAAEILGMFAAPQWGIFDQTGMPVILGDSTIAFDFTGDANVSKYPVEAGGFADYNKVQVPFSAKYTFSKGGSVAERADFLNAVDAAKKSLYLFVALTPEVAYQNINVDHYDVKRTAKSGVTLLTVDVWCEEIRQAPALQFSNAPTAAPTPITNPANPEAADPVQDGTIQPSVASSQTSTPGMGTTTSTPGMGTTPATIQQPGAALTNSTGNSPPPSSPSAAGSTITYNGNDGPASGTVTSMNSSGTGYNLSDGSFVGLHLVTNITPPGFTQVQ
jgi:hypothetical protein